MSKRPIPEQLEIIEMCVRAIWREREIEDDERYDGAMVHFSNALNGLYCTRQALEEAGL